MITRFTHRIALLLVVALVAATFPLAAPRVSAAEVESASVTSGNLRAVAFASASVAVAVADNGVIVRSTDGGATWSQVRAADSYSFRGVDFWNENSGVAVDYLGRVAQTTNGGATWTNVSFGIYPDMDQNDYYSHHDVAAQKGGMVAITGGGDDALGDGSRIGATSFRTTGALDYWKNPLVATKPHWYYNTGSVSWETEGWGEFLDIEWADGTTVWAAGIDYWSTWDTQNTSKFPLFKSADGGATYVPVTGFGQTHFRFEGVAFSGTNSGIVVGKNLTSGARVAKYTTNAGVTWTDASSGISGSTSLNAVDMSTSTNGWAVGEDGAPLRTTNGGSIWTATTVTGGNSNALYDVTFLPSTNSGLAVGANGTVLRTTDGATWTKATVASPPDTTAPAAPTGVTATATSGTTISLSWNAATDPSGIKHYTVYTQAGVKVADVTHPTTSYTVTALSPSTTYGFQVSATDNANNEGAKSAVASATTFDTTPPAAPTGLTATATGTSTIALSWSASTDPSGIKHYTVYTQAGVKVADVTHPTTSYTVTGLSPSTTYGFQVSATDNANKESDKSTAKSATTLAPPPAPKLEPVYRFYNRTNGTHFFTNSAEERAMVNAKWPHIFTDEGVAYQTNPANNVQPLYRFYNKNNGSHFYTASAEEAAAIQQKWPHIFSLDGQTYKVSPSPIPGSVTVYRFYNKNNGSHFYTASAEEADMVRARWSATYTFEGPAFWLGQ